MYTLLICLLHFLPMYLVFLYCTNKSHFNSLHYFLLDLYVS